MVNAFAVAFVVVILALEPTAVVPIICTFAAEVAVDKITYILTAACKIVRALTIELVVVILTLVASSAFVSKHSVAVAYVVHELSFVDITVAVVESALSVHIVAIPLALVAGVIVPVVCAETVALVFRIDFTFVVTVVVILSWHKNSSNTL